MREGMSFSLSFHQALLGPSGAHWLDDPPDLSCLDSTRQHALDDPLLSCNPLPAVRGCGSSACQFAQASPDGMSGARSTVVAHDLHGEGRRAAGLIIRLIIQTIRRDPSGSVWTDDAGNLSRPDP